MDKNHLTIKAKKHEETQEDTKSYRKSEFKYGDFSRVIYFPQEINIEATKAKLEHGILCISAPKFQPEKTELKKLEIE